MRNNKFLAALVSILMMVTSCADPDLAPIVTFDSAEKGAYVRLLTETNKLINLLDIPGSGYTYSVEFVDVEKGNQVANYTLDVIFTTAAGVESGPFALRSFSEADFIETTDGFKGVSDISISPADLVGAAGISVDDLEPGDVFEVKGALELKSGARFTADNSSSTVNGAAFRGHFDFDMPAGCPSDLGGSYAYDGSDFWCNSGSGSGDVNIVDQGAGKYNFNDWSFGGYTACYGSLANQPSLTFTEVCQVVSFTGFVDSFGDTWTYVSEINGNEWKIEWSNTYGESGVGVIKYTGGADWPFTLK